MAPHAPRSRIDLAALHLRLGEAGAAFDTLQTLLDVAPLALPLVAHSLCEAAIACGRSKLALRLLETSYAQDPSLDVLDAIMTLSASDAHGPNTPGGRDWYLKHLEREPSLVAAAKWIAGERLEHEQFHPQVQRALDHAARPLMRYRCAACGFDATQHFWQCPGCQAWDSYPARRVEEL